jgi:hypothetical protein
MNSACYSTVCQPLLYHHGSKIKGLFNKICRGLARHALFAAQLK